MLCMINKISSQMASFVQKMFDGAFVARQAVTPSLLESSKGFESPITRQGQIEHEISPTTRIELNICSCLKD